MMILEQIELTLNGRQHWLSIGEQPLDDGAVRVVVNVHGHFATTAASDAPGDVAAAIGELFDSMATGVKRATDGVVGDCTASHPAAGMREYSDILDT